MQRRDLNDVVSIGVKSVARVETGNQDGYLRGSQRKNARESGVLKVSVNEEDQSEGMCISQAFREPIIKEISKIEETSVRAMGTSASFSQTLDDGVVTWHATDIFTNNIRP